MFKNNYCKYIDSHQERQNCFVHQFKDPNQYRQTITPTGDYLLMDGIPCNTCGQTPKNHGNAYHKYEARNMQHTNPMLFHCQYQPQKDHLGVINNEYFSNYENVIENQHTPVNDQTRQTNQNGFNGFNGHPHDHQQGLPGFNDPRGSESATGFQGYTGTGYATFTKD